MKALSIQQPWAWAILHAGKDVENRTWSTTHRGELAIHATSLQPSWKLPPGVTPPPAGALVQRAVLGIVEVVEVVKTSRSRWFLGPFGFVLRNPRPLRQPIRCPGNRGIWELAPLVERAVRSDLERAAPAAADRFMTIPVRQLTITQANLDNHHLYLTEAMDLFPADVLGGADASQAGRTVCVLWGRELVHTDIVRARKIFRRRGWVRRFFAENQVRAGNRVLLQQLEPYVYRVAVERN